MSKEQVAIHLNKLRTMSPLVHNITNYVVMNTTANALLAIGASPMMAHAKEEVEDMVQIASSLVINIGTFSPYWIESMLIAGKKAKSMNKPVTLDPVGAGANSSRTQICKKILQECTPDIIRGNASEIMALRDSNIKTKGADSTHSSDDAVEIAKSLAIECKAIVIVSGATDYITDGEQVLTVHEGNRMMEKVTGMGCTATAIVGAFSAVDKNLLMTSFSAMSVMGIAGEKAAELSTGPGSFQMNFLDSLYQMKL